MNFEYKDGDKVLCKKFLHDKKYYMRFYQGTYYEIDTVYTLSDPDNDDYIAYYIQVRNGKNTHIFKFFNTPNSAHEYDFYDYFYSKKEMRKLKLDKIKKNV